MPSIPVNLTDPIPLSLTLFDGATGKFPQTHIFDSSDVEVSGSPFDLAEVDTGRYTNAAFTPLTEETFTAKFIVYNDSGHTSESATHDRAEEAFFVRKSVADILRADTIAELAQGAPAVTPSFEEAIMRLYMALTKRVDVDSAFKEFHNNAEVVLWKKAVSDDGTTYTEDTGETGP